MKRETYARITASIESANFRHMKKPEQKSVLDKWIGEGLRAAEGSPDKFTDWEKVHYCEAIRRTNDGLFWLARAALHRAVMPDAPAYVVPVPVDEDLKEINLGHLAYAAEWLSNQPAQPHPIFMRR